MKDSPRNRPGCALARQRRGPLRAGAGDAARASTPPTPSSMPNSSMCSPASGSASAAPARSPSPATTPPTRSPASRSRCVRDREGRLSAFSNVCLHRMSTLLRRPRPHARDRLPLSRLDLQSRRLAARRAGDVEATPASATRGLSPAAQSAARSGSAGSIVTLNPDAPPVAERLADVGRADRRLRHGGLRRDLPRDPRLGHQLEGPRRELHGELPPAGLPLRHDRRPFEARRDGLPAGPAAPSTTTRS